MDAVKSPRKLPPVIWLGDSRERLKEFPAEVQDEMGYALYVAQAGGKHSLAKPLRWLGSGVLEIASAYRGDAYRAMYTVKLAGCVYVLHAFQKKSKRGIATPRGDMKLVAQRLKRAVELHAEREGQS